MAEYNWEPTDYVSVYLQDKEAVRQNFKESTEVMDFRTIRTNGHKLGFEFSADKKLVLATENPVYALRVAAYDKDEAFEEYSWDVLSKDYRNEGSDIVEKIKRYAFKSQHSYEGPVDSVILYETESYEGDCGPMPVFQAFFYQGKLVSGWDYSSGNKQPLTKRLDFFETLNKGREWPIPSEQQVKDFLCNSNLPRTTLTRFEEMLQDN